MDGFTITGNGTTGINIITSGPLQFFTTQDNFEVLLRTVSFVSDDQAPFVARSVTLVVEEIDIAGNPAVIPLTVAPVNDRPILSSSQVTQAVLDDYLPQNTSNPGFNASFLLTEDDVFDIDRNSDTAPDFIGLAITSADAGGIGEWQYWYSGVWVDFPEVSNCSLLLVPPYTRIRFWPTPSPSKMNGTASIEYRAWDGTGNVSCRNGTLDITEGQ